MLIVDGVVHYFGMRITEDALAPGKNPRFGSSNLESWVKIKLSSPC